MNAVGTYILRIIIAAIIVSLTKCFIGTKTTNGKLIVMLGGIFLSITMISPLLTINLDKYKDYFDSISLDAGDVVADGEDMAISSMADIIKSGTESYILEKAALLGLNLEVEVTVRNENPPTPYIVELKGAASPHAKKQLSQYIADELGISEDNQIWM